MIGYLRGEVLHQTGGLVTLLVGGVGYEVHVGARVFADGEEVSLWIRQVIREDAHTLYGFADAGARDLFDLLTEVKGCGPKLALSVLGTLGEDGTVGAVVAQDARALARANGVGARLAERILLELKDKIHEFALTRKVDRVVRKPAGDDLVDALLGLGYRRTEAETAAAEAIGESVELRLKDALRRLAKS